MTISYNLYSMINIYFNRPKKFTMGEGVKINIVIVFPCKSINSISNEIISNRSVNPFILRGVTKNTIVKYYNISTSKLQK